MYRRTLLLRGVVGLAGVTLAGCSQQEGTGAPREDGTDKASPGSTIRTGRHELGGGGDLDTVEPWLPANVTDGMTIEEGDYRRGDGSTVTTQTDAGGESTTGDRLSDTLTFPSNFLSTTESVTVQEQSQFSISFETRTDCPMDVSVVPAEPFRTLAEGDEGHRPEQVREDQRALAREHSPANLRFFGAVTGHGTAELSAGTYFLVFTRACELVNRTAVEFTAEIGSGSLGD